jgi:PAS domain S-box-containing protein
LTVIISDLSDKRKRELELLTAIRSYNVEKRKNELFMQTLDASSVIAYSDISGNFLSVNDQFCISSGYERENLIGQNARILKSGYHGPDFYKDMWSCLLSGKIWVGEICNRKKDGTLYWVYGPIVPILDENGKVEKFFTIRQDITEKKNLENQLWLTQKLIQDSLEWPRSILDSTNQSIIATDKRGLIVIFNRAAEKLLGYLSEELVSQMTPTIFFNSEELKIQSIRLSDRYHTKFATDFEALVAHAERSNISDESIWRIIKKNRETFAAKVSIAKLNNQKKECTGFLFSIQDITMEKILQEQLVELRNQLQSKQGELYV